ncbi:MAG: DUF429 domain-containing protein [Jiangellaceae bacterium]|nr:DUF429 domain-containing protein [Jiangellaceae bacterium]
MRTYLAGAASTVFATPSRAVLEEPFGPGLGVTAQAHALGRRIIHVTELAERDKRIHEVHPEVSFRAMNEGRPLAHRKKSAGGALQRVALLHRHGIELDGLTEAGRAPLDDVLDAAAAAWTGDRIARDVAEPIPVRPGTRLGAVWY